jgi:hypothetical protein
MAFLRIAGSMAAGSGRDVDLPGSQLTIGRDKDNDLVLDSNQISRHHARLVLVAEGWVIEDLGSANGTYVNGVRSDSHLLQHGDVVALGSARLTFSIGPELPASPPTAPYARPPILSPDTLPIAPPPLPPPLPAPGPAKASGSAGLFWALGGCGLFLLLAAVAAWVFLLPMLRQRFQLIG